MMPGKLCILDQINKTSRKKMHEPNYKEQNKLLALDKGEKKDEKHNFTHKKQMKKKQRKKDTKKREGIEKAIKEIIKVVTGPLR